MQTLLSTRHLKSKLLVIVPAVLLAVLINSIYFSWTYWRNPRFFIIVTLITLTELFFNLAICRYLGKKIQERFPMEEQVVARLGFTVGVFILMSVLLQYFLFKTYETFPLIPAELDENRLAWTCLSISIASISMTFFFEGINRFKKWQASQLESRTLNEGYRQSQLKALKSQVSPQFLFNGLNTLSSLIEEDEQRAEQFLDELSKVYNYILRSDNDQLVPLESELKFLKSYSYVLNERFGEGLQIETAVNDEHQQMLIAPLILQVITENAFSQNIVSRNAPLRISVASAGEGLLCISHNLQPKIIMENMALDEGLDALVRKYHFMGAKMSVQETSAQMRRICIPLFTKSKGA